jgi:hypothetical protein
MATGHTELTSIELLSSLPEEAWKPPPPGETKSAP